MRAIQTAYMLCDVCIFVGAARLATTAWPQPRSTMLLTLGAVSLLVADVPWNWLTLTGAYDGTGSITDGGIPFGMLLLALGVRELRLRDVRQKRHEQARVSKGHLALLGAVMIVMPAVGPQSSFKKLIEVPSVILMVLLSSLVFARLVGLVKGERRALVRDEQRRALLVANSQLRELDLLKDQFISTVSHELRTPLTSIAATSSSCGMTTASRRSTRSCSRSWSATRVGCCAWSATSCSWPRWTRAS